MKIRKSAKLGAILFVLWGILHLWVPFEGIKQNITNGNKGQWEMLIGGSAVPKSAFNHTEDATTIKAQNHLMLNFVVDVGGYGMLAIVVAYLIWTQGSWVAYLIGVFIIGIGDLAFLFFMVVPGIIELNAGTIGGPVLWFLAVIITPFGLPVKSNEEDRKKLIELS